MTRKHLRSLALYLFLVLILLMLLAPTVMDSVNLQSRKTKSQKLTRPLTLTTSLLRGKTPQETRKFLDAILQVESCSAVVNNSNVVGNHKGEV